jgi:hypothetical protein
MNKDVNIGLCKSSEVSTCYGSLHKLVCVRVACVDSMDPAVAASQVATQLLCHCCEPLLRRSLRPGLTSQTSTALPFPKGQQSIAHRTSNAQERTVRAAKHARTRSTAQDVTPRFNERLVLSLASCPTCLLMDDELNVLPTSRCRRVKPWQRVQDQGCVGKG